MTSLRQGILRDSCLIITLISLLFLKLELNVKIQLEFNKNLVIARSGLVILIVTLGVEFG